MQKDENGSAKVGLGTTAILRDLDAQEEVKYTLVNPGEVDLSKGKISIASPTGRALVEREIGEVVEVTAPMGTLRYRIEQIC